MVEMLRRTLGATIHIETRHAPDPWICRIDRGQFHHALLNLAPGLIQVLAALTDRPDLPSANTAAGKGERAGGGIMQIVGTGGREGSCYMWRTGSPLLQIRDWFERGEELKSRRGARL